MYIRKVLLFQEYYSKMGTQEALRIVLKRSQINQGDKIFSLAKQDSPNFKKQKRQSIERGTRSNQQGSGLSKKFNPTIPVASLTDISEAESATVEVDHDRQLLGVLRGDYLGDKNASPQA
jgi:hypothetical protein